MTQRAGVVVVSAPRSGSTLVMGLLNQLRGVHVSGEFGQPLLHLSRATRELHRWDEQRFKAARPTWPHYGLHRVNHDEFFLDVANSYRKQLRNSTDKQIETLGFKENDWTGFTDLDRDDYVDMVQTMLGADTLWVLLTRDLDGEAASWGLEKERMRPGHDACAKMHDFLIARKDVTTCRIDYRELATDNKVNLRNVLLSIAVLLLNRPPTADEVQGMMLAADTPHSSNPRFADDIIARRRNA